MDFVIHFNLIHILLFFVYGAIFGSFLNLLIHRLPKKENIFLPASHCPECNTHLKWYHNIPIVSYLVLDGKCSYCKTKIPKRYLLVEVLNATGYMFICMFNGFIFSSTLLCILYSIFLYFVFVKHDNT
jgi:leader peptidase (prepilin peptidase)/N-methyltransferase